MAVTIPGSFPDLPDYMGASGRPIKMGDSSGNAGVRRLGRAINYLLSERCQQNILHFSTDGAEWSWDGATGFEYLPPGYSDGARLWSPISKGWDEVTVKLLCKVTATGNGATITVHSSVDSVAITPSATSWTWETAGSALGVDDSLALETFYIVLAEGTTTVFLKAISVGEEPRGTLP